MSQDNVERVHAAHDAFNRGDLDAAVEYFHADAVWIPYLAGLEAREYRGHAALLDMWRNLREHLAGFRVDPQEVIDGGDWVVIVVEAQGSGPTSGVAVRQRWAQLMSIRDGLIERVEPFPTREEALKAAGLSV
jgi:ketosteroid isomerase-like protein